jgi:hypothetical protein
MLSKKILELYVRAGFSIEAEGKWPNIYSVGNSLEELVRLVVEDCAEAAELAARNFGDTSGVPGAHAAASAVRQVGKSYL